VPGISSAISVPAAAGIPVTHRGVAHEFTVISGHLPPGHPDSLVEWPAVARLRGTVVLLMAVQNLPAIAAALLDGGRPTRTPVAIVSEGTMPGERTVLSTLGAVGEEVESQQVRPPAIVVIGDVVAVANPETYQSLGSWPR
jgi:uroporphyrin-III C-methyltransferase/precorrin-2 dehydrogenase/sirohydrochlorin ferrochelatase